MIRCVYINLDRATQRRATLEANFARYATPGFELARFRAFDAVADADRLVPGKGLPAARACFMSHRQVILDHPDDGPPLMVLEDDAHFGPTFFKAAGPLLAAPNLSSDIIFTDICVPDAKLMTQFARARPPLAAGGKVMLVDLQEVSFAAAVAYIVNPKSLPKLKSLLRPIERVDGAYDILLRNLVNRGHLKASVAFPFLTTLSEHSEVSAIQGDDTITTDLIWNTFRKLVWSDRDLAQCAPLLAAIRERACDEESLMFAPIFCALASARFRTK